jgi:hypothetical protein
MPEQYRSFGFYLDALVVMAAGFAAPFLGGSDGWPIAWPGVRAKPSLRDTLTLPMRRPITITALSLLLSGPLPDVLRAETLAEAAAKEAARRAQGAAMKAPAYTEDELGGPAKGGTLSLMTAPAVKVVPPASTRSSLALPMPSVGDAGARSDADPRGRHSEGEWRAMAVMLQQEIRALTQEVKEREKNPGGMAERTLVCANGSPQCWSPQRANASPRQLLAMARAQLRSAQVALDLLENEARHLSVPPGWLRER